MSQDLTKAQFPAASPQHGLKLRPIHDQPYPQQGYEYQPQLQSQPLSRPLQQQQPQPQLRPQPQQSYPQQEFKYLPQQQPKEQLQQQQQPYPQQGLEYQLQPHSPPPAYNAAAEPPLPIAVIQQQPAPVVATPAIVQQVQAEFGTKRVAATCPYCRSTITTTIDKENGCGAWLWCCLLSTCCLWICCCCCIPFCMDACKIHNHHCPNCTQRLGQYKGSQSCS